MLRAARITSAALLSFGVVLAATGWLYVIQPHSAVPGPPVTDALPLDELSRRSAVPLIVFLGSLGSRCAFARPDRAHHASQNA